MTWERGAHPGEEEASRLSRGPWGPRQPGLALRAHLSVGDSLQQRALRKAEVARRAVLLHQLFCLSRGLHLCSRCYRCPEEPPTISE
ncbi:unnamed protein product [Gulo gulo]|uniref:Uncharacterized protein n=1 Tax=Gulo gulo TaxID=48420 RepID=A0A9X9LND3_GULGU|nr:unnamed protein product [Gulo gulo]